MCYILVKIIDYRLECRLLAAAASLLVREENKGERERNRVSDISQPEF